MSTEPAQGDLAARIELIDQATGRLLAELSQPGLDPSKPTLCEGWTAGHVLTHLARNADGLARSAEGARRGEVVAMYDSAEARDRDIEAGAGRPLPELIDDVTRAAARLRDAWAELPGDGWTRVMQHHLAGLVPVHAQPYMRLGEVLIHHVDLVWRYGPADWPDAFVAETLAEADGNLAKRLPGGAAVDVRATDTGWELSAGDAVTGRVSVTGPASALAAWLVGRRAAALPALTVTGGDLPELDS